MRNKSWNNHIIIKTLVALLFPLILCILFCTIKGYSLFDIYIPSSDKNDCLLYYKMVEGIVEYGMPRGYFGYNESHALVGSLAAWSPILYFPWAIWGRIFGWSYISAILCNIFFFSVSLSLFVLLVRPAWQNLIAFLTILVLYSNISFYLLNVQPEILIASVLIVYIAFQFHIITGNKKNTDIIAMLVLAFILILARPYMVLLVGFPAYWLNKQCKKKSILLIPVAVALIGLLGYYYEMHFFASPYFKPLFDTDLIEKVLSFRFTEAFEMILRYTIIFFQELRLVLKSTYESGLSSGTSYSVWLVTIIAAFLLLLDKKNENKKIINIGYIIITVILFGAIIILYHSAYEGGRHLFVFSVVGCAIFSNNEWSRQSIVSYILLGLLFTILIVKGSFSPEDISIPVKNDHLKATIDYWESVFAEQQIDDSSRYGYEFTIDWVCLDSIQGEIIETRFEELYAVPKGMGINCCSHSYIMDNYDSLKSSFIAAPCGGDIDNICSLIGWDEIGRTKDVVIYFRE